MISIRIFTIIAAIFILLLLLLGGSFYYKTELELKPVVQEVSPDGRAELTVSMVGEPAWPFGPTDCRFELYVEGKRVVKHGFSIHNDGVSATESNFSITWHKDHVEILVTAEEQPDELCIIYYDATVGWQRKDKV